MQGPNNPCKLDNIRGGAIEIQPVCIYDSDNNAFGTIEHCEPDNDYADNLNILAINNRNNDTIDPFKSRQQTQPDQQLQKMTDKTIDSHNQNDTMRE